MSKKVKVVNFKSENFGPVIFRTKDSIFHFYQYYSIMQDMGDEHHDLYYVEREYELKKGEWAIQFNDIGSKPVEVFQWDYDTHPAPEAVIFKVVASTNSDIKNCPGISNWQLNKFCIDENDEAELITDDSGDLILDDDGNVKLLESIETVMIDWNKLSIDQHIAHLEDKFMFDSSGTAKSVYELIRAYKTVADSSVSREDQINNGLMYQDEPKDSRFVSYMINYFPRIYKFIRWRYMKFIEKN